MANILCCVITTAPIFKPDEPNENGTSEDIPVGSTFFDDFYSIDRSKWGIVKQQWGADNNGPVNGGVVPQNVNYTGDGILVLQGNGDNYRGGIKGLGANYGDGRRTGAAIASNQLFDYGTFEIRMKALPRIGTYSAIWLFMYGQNGAVNHEIDIELPGAYGPNRQYPSFTGAWFTNWISETVRTSTYMPTQVLQSDGGWHRYKFIWEKDYIEYYIDDVMYSRVTENIPFYKMRLWIGVWFPNPANSGQGYNDFETDYMLVDWVSYTQSKTSGAALTYSQGSPPPLAASSEYPAAPVALPDGKLISNGCFDHGLTGWQVGGTTPVTHTSGGADGGAYIEVINGITTNQTITTTLCGDYLLSLYAYKTAAANTVVTINYYSILGVVIDTKTISITGTSWEEYTLLLSFPAYVERINIRLGQNGCYDKISLGKQI